MKPRLTLLYVVLAAVVAGCGQGTIATDGPPPDWPPQVADSAPFPNAVVKDAERDFGVMAVGEKRVFKFKVTNEGKGSLIVKPGKPTCGCSSFTTSNENLAPGESAELLAEVRPDKASDNFTVTLPLGTNDPQQQVIRLMVRGDVQETIILHSGNVLKAGVLNDDRPTELDTTISSGIFTDLKIDEIICPHPKIKARVTPMKAELLQSLRHKVGYGIKVSILPGVPVGRFSQTIFIKASANGQQRKFQVQVLGTRMGPFTFLAPRAVDWQPRSMTIRLGRFKAAEGKSASLLLVTQSLKDQQLDFAKVSSDPAHLQLSINLEADEALQNKGRSRFRLTISVPPGSPAASRHLKNAATIRVKTNHPDVKEIVFRVEYSSA